MTGMFHYEDVITDEDYKALNELKTFHPKRLSLEAGRRKKGKLPHSRVVFAAADHNARMINAYQGNPLGLSNRREYLSRLVRMLSCEEVDGVEGSPDIIEDLMLLNYLFRTLGRKEFLAGKWIIGTVNRGGLKDVAWEMDDMCTCFTVERLAELNLDGIKFMLRINPDSEVNKHTLLYCAQTVNEAVKYQLPIFIEGLYIRTEAGNYVMKTDLESLVKTVGVVGALGCSSQSKWIELPLNEQYEVAAAATTNSILVVPDEVGVTKEEVIAEYTKQAGIAPNVRGILLGRNVMYSSDDPAELAEAIAKKWHAAE